ncbi:hypothetical protein IFM47457_04988 [Aspergillus lentulus]|nr:hypothetical protein IFM47457_04988 [Aspergillus lentulus]
MLIVLPSMQSLQDVIYSTSKGRANRWIDPEDTPLAKALLKSISETFTTLRAATWYYSAILTG